jgi:DNA-binding transcriptional regulator GbsR (MarR family)
MNVTPLIQSFVLHFGEMGSRWGINRTVGQIYALLFVSQKPLNADEIAEALAFSRSNVSMGLKELDAWNLIRLQHLPGDRREYFSAPEDVWAIFRTLAEERRKREVDPTLTMLRAALMEQPTNADDRHAQARMKAMHELIEMVTLWFNDVQKLDEETLRKLMKMGSAIHKFLEFKEKLGLGRKSAVKKAASESLADSLPEQAQAGAESNVGADVGVAARVPTPAPKPLELAISDITPTAKAKPAEPAGPTTAPLFSELDNSNDNNGDPQTQASTS